MKDNLENKCSSVHVHVTMSQLYMYGSFVCSLCIKGFHLDPIPEPPGSYMNGKKFSYMLNKVIYIYEKSKMSFSEL